MAMVNAVRAYQGKVTGPATALAAYMAQVCWELTANANLLGPGGLRLSLRANSSKQIKEQLNIAWDWHCHRQTLHRKGIQSQLDTHSHQYLECLAFQNVRAQHPTAVQCLHTQPQWCFSTPHSRRGGRISSTSHAYS